MTHLRFAALAAIVFMTPRFASAQSAPAPLLTPPRVATAAASPSTLVAMYEDIEIFSHILNRTLNLQRNSPAANTFYYNTTPGFGATTPNNMLGTMPGMPGGTMGLSMGMAPASTVWSTVAASYTPAEGAYLKNYGVVYMLVLPAPSRDPRPETAKVEPKAMSDWDRQRKVLRGEKVEAEAKDPAKKEATVTDRILKALAENGQHFSQLGPQEIVTVVVTFHDEHPTPRGRSSNTAPPVGTRTGSSAAPSGPGGAGAGPGTSAATGSPSGTGGTSSDAVRSSAVNALGELVNTAQSANDYELLGDLHLKQNRIDEAIAAYKKAVEQKGDSQHLADAYMKLAQAHMKAQQLKEAEAAYQQALTRARSFLEKADATGITSPSPLPSKLIITATKERLDQVGKGTMSFEEFKKAISIDYLSFSPEKKADAKAKP